MFRVYCRVWGLGTVVCFGVVVQGFRLSKFRTCGRGSKRSSDAVRRRLMSRLSPCQTRGQIL